MDVACRPPLITPIESIEQLKQKLDSAQDQSGAIFRGQADSAWPLVPSAWRENSLVHRKFLEIVDCGDEARLVKYLPENIRISLNASEGARRRMLRLCAHLLAEQHVVAKFCQKCDSIALKVPAFDRPQKFIPLKDLGNIPEFDLDSSFAFAQHFGIPTRLLDFSQQPLKALFFAARDYQHGLPIRPRKFAVVIASYMNEPDMERNLMAGLGRPVGVRRVLRSEVPYLHVQDGLFLECGTFANNTFFTQERWPNFEEMMVGWRVEKLEIEGDLAPAILAFLQRRGIDELTMMPSFERVALSMRAGH